MRSLPGIFIVVSLACGSTSSNPSEEGTLQAISDQVRQTGTAAALAETQANSADQSAAATQTALAALGPEALTGTAQAYAPILAELPKYGVDPASGKVAWIHPPVSLEVEGYMQYDYINHFIATITQDFVMSADITWDAIGSESSCGFVMRSDGNENAMNTYLATISRVASGHFLFLTVAKGEIVTGQDIYAYGRDPGFDWQNNATNNLTVVGLQARLGGDHLRTPVDEEQLWDDQGQPIPEALGLLDAALDWSAELGLRAVVDLHILRSHHFNAQDKPLWTEPEAQRRFLALWITCRRGCSASSRRPRRVRADERARRRRSRRLEPPAGGGAPHHPAAGA